MSYGVALALLVGSYCAHRLYMLYSSFSPTQHPHTVNTTDTESAGTCLLEPRLNQVGTVPAVSVTVDR